MRAFYLACFVAGCILPLSQLAPAFAAHGLSLTLFVREALGTPMSRVAWLDVIVSAVALTVWVVADNRSHRHAGWWLPILLTITVGVSAGLPLHLYLREGTRRR